LNQTVQNMQHKLRQTWWFYETVSSGYTWAMLLASLTQAYWNMADLIGLAV